MCTPSTPAVFKSRIASRVFQGLQPFGGSTSTVVTNSPLAILRAQFERSSAGTTMTSGGFSSARLTFAALGIPTGRA